MTRYETAAIRVTSLGSTGTAYASLSTDLMFKIDGKAIVFAPLHMLVQPGEVADMLIELGA